MANVPFTPGLYMGFLVWGAELAKTTDFVITTSLNGTLFTNTGANGTVVFTLPAIAANYRFGFFLTADFQVDIRVPTADLNKVVAFNNVTTADGISFQTSGEKLGAAAVFQSNAAGTLWYVFNASAGANTVTVLTNLS